MHDTGYVALVETDCDELRERIVGGRRAWLAVRFQSYFEQP